jgi:hypothetical protein
MADIYKFIHIIKSSLTYFRIALTAIEHIQFIYPVSFLSAAILCPRRLHQKISTQLLLTTLVILLLIRLCNSLPT